MLGSILGSPYFGKLPYRSWGIGLGVLFLVNVVWLYWEFLGILLHGK